LTNRSRYITDVNLGGGGGSNGDWEHICHVVTAGEITAKKFTIAPTPDNTDEVTVLVPGGTVLKAGTDYTIINGNELNWNGLGLEGVIAENDEVILLYFS
jgi:hypothetical protein